MRLVPIVLSLVLPVCHWQPGQSMPNPAIWMSTRWPRWPRHAPRRATRAIRKTRMPPASSRKTRVMGPKG